MREGVAHLTVGGRWEERREKEKAAHRRWSLMQREYGGWFTMDDNDDVNEEDDAIDGGMRQVLLGGECGGWGWFCGAALVLHCFSVFHCWNWIELLRPPPCTLR